MDHILSRTLEREERHMMADGTHLVADTGERERDRVPNGTHLVAGKLKS